MPGWHACQAGPPLDCLHVPLVRCIYCFNQLLGNVKQVGPFPQCMGLASCWQALLPCHDGGCTTIAGGLGNNTSSCMFCWQNQQQETCECSKHCNRESMAYVDATCAKSRNSHSSSDRTMHQGVIPNLNMGNTTSIGSPYNPPSDTLNV